MTQPIDSNSAQMQVQAQAQMSTSIQTPMRLSLLQNLTTQSLLLNQLFTLLSSGSNPTPTMISQLRNAIQISTVDLSILIKETYEHQVAWKELQQKRGEVEILEGRVRGLIRGLEKGRGELEGLVREGSEVLNRVEKARKDPLPTSTLLAHASALARHSSAPISSSSINAPNQNQTALDNPPWPTEMHMRQGLLFQLEGSMSGVGDTGIIGQQPAQETQAQATVVPDSHPQQQQIHEESGRRYDPNAVFQLELNSDDSDDD